MRRTDEELEEIVWRALSKIGLQFVVCPDLMTVITKLKVAYPGFNYQRVPDAALPNAYARYISERRLVEISESTFVGMQRGVPRARMSVWEEIAHFLLGHEGVLNRSVAKTITERAIARVRAQEAEAKRCAAILAAPQPQVPEDVTIEYLMTAHGLSEEAATLRLDEIQRLRNRARGDKRPLPQAAVDFLSEARRRGVHIATAIDD